mgnify:CR=1 FL=1
MERPWSLFLQELMDMGFDQNRAARALVATHNTGIEPAVAWLIEHAEDPDQGSEVVSKQTSKVFPCRRC